MTAWLRFTDPETGTRSLVRADVVGGLLPHQRPTEPAYVLSRIDVALAESVAEDEQGYVTWFGSADSMAVTFIPLDGRRSVRARSSCFATCSSNLALRQPTPAGL